MPLLRSSCAGQFPLRSVHENRQATECTNLHKAEGLTEVKHLGASSLDHQTLRACAAYLPDVFLLGVDYSADELRLLRILYPKA